MGGRGGSSGLANETGFSYKMNGKTVIVQKTTSGVVLVNGAPNRYVDYVKMLKAAKGKEGFRKLSASQIEKQREKRYKDYQSHDYELIGNKGARKSVYRPRRKR